MSGEEADNDWLLEAAGEGEFETAKNFRGLNGDSFFNSSEPLHLAAEGCFYNICKFLIEKRGFDANKPNIYGETPLFQACYFVRKHDEEENTKIVKLLLNHGADVSVLCPFDGSSLLHYAVASGWKVLVNIFLEAGLDVNTPSSNGSTPLHTACLYGHKNIVEILCQNNANVNARDKDGWSPLHEAAFWEPCDTASTGCIEILLKFGSNVNAQGAHMETALHCLVFSKENIAIMLLDNGCDINTETRSGQTALDTVIRRGKVPKDYYNYNALTEILSGLRDGTNDMNGYSFADDTPVVWILLGHFVKLKTAKLFVSQKNLSHLEEYDFSDVEEQCQEEIRAAQNEELLSGITLYDILSSGVHPTYARNKPLMEALECFNWDSFPLYKSIILNNVKKSKLRHDLLELGEKWLRILLKTSNIFNIFPVPAKIMSAEILSMIVSFLSDDELNTLITCGEELRHQLVHKDQKPPEIQQLPKCHQPPEPRRSKRLKMRNQLQNH